MSLRGFQRFELDFLVFGTFGPTVDTRACVRAGRLQTFCEYFSMWRFTSDSEVDIQDRRLLR